MFYSQFILAKKGPLGTIWIAAHLERKLRKNQVADTDIGVSVDSILCPEVPIALRLSSHLLLGVVRIYSRKVNYLFHDCSEALLKIKQAYRSTAVDLPPEESTAPYHSITLPETFHLDDFELPESVFQGDFVDHHISTKEQITLQDTVDGAAFPTVQFGLDERFGDDSASHIGLDLDEELFLAKNSLVQHSSINLEVNERAGNQGQSSSALHVTGMDIDGDQNGSVKNIDTEAPEDHFYPNIDNNDSDSAMEEAKKNNPSSIWQGYNIQTPDLNEVFFPNEGTHTSTSPSRITCIADGVPPPEPAECAHAPQTPGLVEEAFPANKHESPVLSPQRKLSPSLVEEAPKLENCSVLPECPESMTANDPFNVITMEQQQTDETQIECMQKNADVDDKLICTEVSVLPVDHQDHAEGEILLPEKTQMEGVDHDASKNRVLHDESLVNDEGKLTTYNSNDASSGMKANTCDAVTCELTSNFHFRPCTSNANLGTEPFMEDGTSAQNAFEGSTEDLGVQSEVPITEKRLDGAENLIDVQGKGLCMENATDSRMLESGYTLTTDVPLVDLLQTDIQQLNCSAISEFLEPEKMLLAPSGSGNVNLVNELSQVTAEKGVSESDESNRISSLSGKKRRLQESSSVLENDSSAKLASRPRVRRSTEHVPDDDDLLSSILGAKRTPQLRVGPTPTKSAALKRQKLISSLGMPKRKVLVDDTTVLHADAIRQQLINTEDIRRVRKKAPCTRPEIWLIQKSSLEEEIFDEPTLTGISDELNALHTRKYDTKFIVVASDNEKPELASIMPNIVDGETQGPCSTPISSGALNDKGTGECSHTEIMLDDVSHNAVPFVETCDNLQQMVNGMDLTNNELSEIKDSSTSHFTENPSEEFPDTTNNPEGTNASVLLDGLPKVSPLASSINDVLVPSIPNNLHEDEELMVTDVSTFSLNTQSPLGDAIGMGDAADLMAASGARVTDGDVSLDTEVLTEHTEQKGYDGENPNVGIIGPEEPEMISVSLTEQNPENGQIPLAIGETSGLQEFNVDGDVVLESTAMDSAMVGETNDFYNSIDCNDTGFLNVDDDAEYEEAVNDMPSNENAQSLENSGWSSRTRGVARYLKILFDEETGHARKTVAMDHLIAGKSRKEASRMFFETLVLKTKDFIHVEQETPFGYITIKPRGKIFKSEF